jgi:protein-L-isoaspartate(D-aspartate) O-methyltransferase
MKHLRTVLFTATLMGNFSYLSADSKTQKAFESGNMLCKILNQKRFAPPTSTLLNICRRKNMTNADFELKREQMLKLLKKRNIKNEEVLQAMQSVQRHLFVPESMKSYAYEDHPLEIACEQTISQPYMVAFMTEAAQVDNQSIVLEIGTGSGYQAAILGQICKEVYSIEVIPDLGNSAARLLKEQGYSNIHVKIEDGYLGWEQKAPFDAIIVTAAAKKLSPSLLKQLKVGGRIIIPLEDKYHNQTLVKITKTDMDNHYISKNLFDVRFVPMVGLASQK